MVASLRNPLMVESWFVMPLHGISIMPKTSESSSAPELTSVISSPLTMRWDTLSIKWHIEISLTCTETEQTLHSMKLLLILSPLQLAQQVNTYNKKPTNGTCLCSITLEVRFKKYRFTVSWPLKNIYNFNII